MSTILLTSLGMKGVGNEIINILAQITHPIAISHIIIASNVKEDKTAGV